MGLAKLGPIFFKTTIIKTKMSAVLPAELHNHAQSCALSAAYHCEKAKHARCFFYLLFCWSDNVPGDPCPLQRQLSELH